MDNITHTLFGLALARTGLERTTGRATAALLVGANLPDIDLVTWLGGSIRYLEYHRGITHSMLGLVVESALLAGLLSFFPRRRSGNGKTTRLEMLFLMALIGSASHLLLDYTNSYGVRPFLPFQDRWYAADLVFIIDPWLLLILVFGTAMPSLSKLVSQEIGATTRTPYRSAVVTLCLVVAFWGGKWFSHQRALDELAGQTYPTGTPIRLGALPRFLNPFGWYGIAETESAYHLLFAGWRPPQINLASRLVKTLRKAPELQIVNAALQSNTAKVFTDFARYPLFQVVPRSSGFEVFGRDLRFDFATRSRSLFLFTVLLDRNLNVISESFRY